MKVTISIDSFKGSLTTFEACSAVRDGIKEVFGQAEILCSPLADGGEGTVEAIVSSNDGVFREVNVLNPLGKRITASYGYIERTKTAVIEMSAASGITLIDKEELNPMVTTTYGTGEMIADAISNGCRRFIIGIGGSATNDGGIGMLQALGFEFLDSSENPVSFGASGLRDICTIRTSNAIKELCECSFTVACDVKNVLCGKNGCSAVFGPQKGADEVMIKNMDAWLENYSELTKSVIPDADKDAPGTGAAGGMGYALMNYLGAQLRSGVDMVINETGLENMIKNSDIVVTGEGRLDGQSHMGKAPVGVARIAKKYNKPVIAFAGGVTDDATECNAHGIDAFFSVVKSPCSLEEAMNKENAYKNLKDTASQVFRLIKATS